MAATCKSCGATLVWAETLGGKRIPLNAMPTATGNIDLTGRIARYVTPDVNASPLRYTAHFSTCPQAGQFRKKRKAARR